MLHCRGEQLAALACGAPVCASAISFWLVADWVVQRLGGYMRLDVAERREAVAELTEGGMTQHEAADVLGVDQATVSRDARASAADEGGRNEQPHDHTDDADASDVLDVLDDDTLTLAENGDDLLAMKERDARVLALVSKAVAGASPVATAQTAAEGMLALGLRVRRTTGGKGGSPAEASHPCRLVLGHLVERRSRAV